jgi:hypothetical protein
MWVAVVLVPDGLSSSPCLTRTVATARARRISSKERKETRFLDGKEEGSLFVFSFPVCSLKYGITTCIFLYRLYKW